MLPDLSAWHIAVLVMVALIVVGPKELPGLLRKIGQFMNKLRGLANEFRASFDEMARQSELDELRKEVEAMRAAASRPAEELKGHLEPLMTLSADEPATTVGAVGSPPAVMTPLAEAPIEPAPQAQPEPVKAKPARKPRAAPAKTEGSPAAKPAAKRTRAKPPPPPETGA